MTYIEAIEYIESIKNSSAKPTLDRIALLCSSLGSPQKNMHFIHVAGTNGKGSTCVFISEILRTSGLKTGLYTSPYIYRFNERIKINGKDIDDDALAHYTGKVKNTIEKIRSAQEFNPTQFEIITAIAFLYFYEKKCDIIVLETGLGGRFDATNIIEKPLLSVITSISMDHAEILGDSLSKIAREKCGIIKNNGKTLSYPLQADEVFTVIKQNTGLKNNTFTIPDTASLIIKKTDLCGSVFDIGDLKNIEISLCGFHQIYNAITAIDAVNVLREEGFNITNDDILKGLKKASWPARMEKISPEPLIITDGAHNEDGITAFCRTVKNICRGNKIIIIWGMLNGKHAEKCIKQLGSICDILITTNVESSRSEKSETLFKIASPLSCEKYCTNSVREAVDLAAKKYTENSVIFAVGSLYMASEVKNAVSNKF